MFEASLDNGSVWKKLVEAVKELVSEVNISTTPAGISIQAMDSAHVALVALNLTAEGFQDYQSERNSVLGVNFTVLSKVLKTMENNDKITLRCQDGSDTLNIVSQQPNNGRRCDYSLKLMDIESDAMGIPEMDYQSRVTLSSSEFSKMCRDMSLFGETVTVQVERDRVVFSGTSDMTNGEIELKAAGASADATRSGVKREAKKEPKAEVKNEMKNEPHSDDAPYLGGAKASEGSFDGVEISMVEPVTLSFALRYFTIFSKAGTLADKVTLHLANESPCVIEFVMPNFGNIRYFLAPKVAEE